MAHDDMDDDELEEHVAWNDETKLMMLWQFLEDNRLASKAMSYMRKAMLEECKECDCEYADDESEEDDDVTENDS